MGKAGQAVKSVIGRRKISIGLNKKSLSLPEDKGEKDE